MWPGNEAMLPSAVHRNSLELFYPSSYKTLCKRQRMHKIRQKHRSSGVISTLCTGLRNVVNNVTLKMLQR